jgi:hypothetical protein
VNITLKGDYRPFDRQAAFHRSEARFKGAFSGNRGGKTMSGAYEFIRRIFLDLAAGKGRTATLHSKARLHRLLYWVVAPDYKLGKTSLDNILRLLPPEAIVDYNRSDHTLWLVGDIKIELRSGENPSRLVAESLNGLWIDEAPRVKPEAWRGALRARLADRQGWLIATGSPLGGRSNWVFIDLVSASGRSGIETFTWETADNPYIPRSEIEWAAEHLPPSHFKRDWQASWDSHGGAIFEEFKDETHVISEAQLRMEYANAFRGDLRTLFRRVAVGVDWGYTAAGCMLVVGQVADDDFIVLEESYAAGRPKLRGAGATWFSEAKRLKDKWGATIFACDPEDPDSIHDFADNGIPAIGARNGVSLGIRRVAEAMHPVKGKPGLRVLSTCTNLIREIRNYAWKPNREQTGFLEEPDDNCSDHALDPMRYAVLELNPVSVVDRFRNRNTMGRPPG